MKRSVFHKTLQSSVDDMAKYVVAKGIIDEAELNGTVLPEGTTSEYIDLVANSSEMLSLISYQNMGRHKQYRLNTFEMEDYVLQARPAAGSSLDAANGSSGTFGTPTLYSEDMVAFATLHDEAIETSIVDGQLTSLVLNKLASKSGMNMVTMFLFGDTTMDLTGTTPGTTESKKRNLYKTMDGFIKLSGKKIYGAGLTPGFDKANIADVLDKLEVQIGDDYIDRAKMAYFLDRSQFNAFQDLITSLHPNTSTGVDATTGRKAFYWRGIRVIEELNLSRFIANTVTGGTGQVAILARVDALFYGIPEELIKANSWRENKEFAYYVTNEMFPACTISVADAVAVAFYDKEA